MTSVTVKLEIPEDNAVYDIARFMKLGGQKVPKDFAPADFSLKLDLYDIKRVVFEEFEETSDALWNNEWAEALDGFIDTAFAALTGAIRLAGAEKAKEAWETVIKANLAKVDGTYGPVEILNGKIQKPEGFVHPDIKGILLAD